MKYEHIRKAIFLSRPNRFIARILLDGEEKICHVKNTGRCRELLLPGREIYVQEFPCTVSENAHRKTAYDLIAVQKGARLINMDSLAPNKVAPELLPSLFPTLLSSRAEIVFGNSRFDFAGEYAAEGETGDPSDKARDKKVRRFFLEVKGVTLEQDGEVMFPDAPTERGRKHLEELIRAKAEGYDAAVLFLIQMENVTCFRPNFHTDPLFANALCRAADAGVRIFAYDCRVAPDRISPKDKVPIILAPA